MKAISQMHHTLCLFAGLSLFSSFAVAQTSTQNPGSLLLFPDVSSDGGRVTLVTVTNTDGPPAGVETTWFYHSDDCLEFNRTETLAGNDTLTVVVGAHAPFGDNRYLYVQATSPNQFNQPIVFNHLIGEERIIDGFKASEYSVSPFVFQGIGPEGSPTDIDGDGLRDLNGIEYSEVPDEIIVPRFLGQSPVLSELVLIDLTGRQFSTVASFFVYNDNATIFSQEVTFTCWDRLPLSSISLVFDNAFLANNSAHDPGEIVGAPQQESGWMEINGAIAFSATTSIIDPAILAFLIEGTGKSSNAGLPFGTGLQDNGALLPLSVFGNN